MKSYSFRVWVEAKEDEFTVKKSVLTAVRTNLKNILDEDDPDEELLEKSLKDIDPKQLMIIVTQGNALSLDRQHLKALVNKIKSDEVAEYSVANLIEDLSNDSERNIPASSKTYAPKTKTPPPAQGVQTPPPQAPVPPPAGPAPTQAPAPTAIPPQG